MLTRNSRRRTAGALAALAAMGVSMVPLLSAAPAHAATAGPVDAATGIPGFFTDVTGVSLAPCFAGPPACSATKASFLTGSAPATYFSATATLPTAPPPGVPAANSTMLLAVEATAPNTAPFQRKQSQIQVSSARTYVLTDPYGAQAFSAQISNDLSPAQLVPLRNAGAAPINIGSPIGSAFFSVSDSQTAPCTGVTLAPLGTCAVNVTFSPAAGGPASGSLLVTRNDPAGPMTVALSGTGVVAGPAVVVRPTSLAFAPQPTGLVSAPQTITISNNGNAVLNVTKLTFAGANPTDFTQTTTCLNGGITAGVVPGSTSSLAVTYKPTR